MTLIEMLKSLEPLRTIWIVEDSLTDAERVRRLLSSEYEVRVLSDGAIALELLSSGQTPDLLLLDWMMPGISGVEVCRYVRSESAKLPQFPIILLTAQHGSQEIIEAFRSGANDYISKPFVDEELKARVDSQLGARKLLERAEKAEADLLTLLANAPDPIFAIDSEGIVSFVNDEGVHVLALKREQILGQSFQALIPGISTRHFSVGPGESLIPIPDVQIGTRTFSPSLKILASDSAATTTVALRDVTARRKTEARRLDFYSIIAHDLRTPITAVLLRLHMAFRGKHGVLPAGLLTDLRKTEENLRSLVAMVNDFLEIAKLEGVGYKIDRKPVDMGELFKSTLEDFEPLMEKNQLTWKPVDLESKLLVAGDPQRLAQVLSNLVGNAIKFTPGPGVITTRVCGAEEYVEVSVEDTGRGIAKEELPTLFDRFTRASESAGETPGTGLGLMIVREIVEAHGGLIGVDSELGKGSRFWFRIPRYRGAKAEAGTDASAK
jgi:signal transduction histidine kinase